MFRLITLVKNSDETSTGFIERLAAKVEALGGPDRAYVFRCRDVTENDLHAIVTYLWGTGSEPNFQWLRVEHEGTTVSCEFWLGWDESIVTRMMEQVLDDLGDIENDPTPLH